MQWRPCSATLKLGTRDCRGDTHIIYVGRRTPYPFSTRWLDEFDDPLLAHRLYSHGFMLVDVTTISDDKIMRHRSMAALTLLQKHIRQRDLAELMDRLSM